MSARNADERHLAAQLAANTRWAQVEDRAAATEPARRRLAEQYREQVAAYLTQVDPDSILPEDERTRRAISARKADLARAALQRAQARRERQLGELFDDGGEAA